MKFNSFVGPAHWMSFKGQREFAPPWSGKVGKPRRRAKAPMQSKHHAVNVALLFFACLLALLARLLALLLGFGCWLVAWLLGCVFVCLFLSKCVRVCFVFAFV